MSDLSVTKTSFSCKGEREVTMMVGKPANKRRKGTNSCTVVFYTLVHNSSLIKYNI